MAPTGVQLHRFQMTCDPYSPPCDALWIQKGRSAVIGGGKQARENNQPVRSCTQTQPSPAFGSRLLSLCRCVTVTQSWFERLGEPPRAVWIEVEVWALPLGCATGQTASLLGPLFLIWKFQGGNFYKMRLRFLPLGPQKLWINLHIWITFYSSLSNDSKTILRFPALVFGVAPHPVVIMLIME